MWPVKILIRLHGCTGCSEPSLTHMLNCRKYVCVCVCVCVCVFVCVCVPRKYSMIVLDV